MKKFLYIFFFFLFINQVKSQYSIAGTHGAIYVNIIPDTLLNPQPNDTEAYFIDINQDGINDIKIEAGFWLHSQQQGDYVNDIKISSLDSFTSFSFGKIDSLYFTNSVCNANHQLYTTTVLKVYNTGDTILNGNYISSGYLAYYSAFGQCGFYFGSAEWQNKGDVFFGVKYQTASDTSFGWVKVNVTGYSTVLIEEFSLGSPLSGVNSLADISNSISIYPNPSLGIFTLSSSKKILSIEISDVLGNIIFKSVIKNLQPEINISSQSKGIYFVKVTDDKGNFGVKKIILQ